MKTILITFLTSIAIVAGLFLLNQKPRAATPSYVPITDVTTEARTMRDSALKWFFGFQKENGLMYYQLNPKTGVYATSNNELRQLMGSRLLASRAHESTERMDAHKKNLDFVFKHWYKKEEGKGFILYEDKSKLGGNAMLLRTLVTSPLYETYLSETKATVNGLFALMKEDGSFKAWYKVPEGYVYDEPYLLTFYSGEALLALLEYVEKSGDMSLMPRITKSADFYVEEYITRMSKNYYPAYVPWQTLALEKMYHITKNKKYLDAIFTLNDKLLELQDRSQFIGRFYNPLTPQYGTPHSSSDSVYTESLIHAWALAKDAGDTARTEKYMAAITRALGNIKTLQYQKEVAGFKSERVTYIGAIRQNAESDSVRIDCAQHLIDGLDYYLSMVEKQVSEAR